MDSTTSRPYLYHRTSSKRPRQESESDEDAKTNIRHNRSFRAYDSEEQRMRTTSSPSTIHRGQPQESSSNFSNSTNLLTSSFAGSGAQPITSTMTQDRLAPVHPSFQFDAHHGRLDAGRDIGCGNVVGDNNRIYHAATPEDEHKARLREIKAKLGTHVASDAVLSKATHGEPSLCHPGTRENLLEHILAWVETENVQEAGVAGRSKCIIGAPGSGKSTIMNTLVVELLSDAARRSPGLISAHYCIRRSLQSTTDWTKVLPTLISQLALGNLEVARCVHDLLSHTQQTGILAQEFVKELFLEAMRAHNQTVFVIIDALDEASSPAPLATTLSCVIQLSSPNLRLLLATRNESIVIHNLDQHILDIIRHTIPTEESIREVSDYITTRIRDGVRGLFGRSPSWESWPSESQLQSLSDSAAGLYIWASTAVDFVLSQIQKRGARKRDQMIDDIGNIGMANVNALYLFILRSYLENDEDASKKTTLQWMKAVLGLIVVAEKPLTLDDIIGFFGVDPDDFDVHHFILLTRSILVPGTEPIDGSTTPRFHKTFFDFITTHRAAEFYIDMEEHHGFAAERGFALMEKQLCFNIGNLGSSLSKENYLVRTRIERDETLKLIPDGLIYASTCWLFHLKKAGQDFMVSNLGFIRAFLQDKLLFWLEIMILVHRIEEAWSCLSTLGVRLGSHRTGTFGTSDKDLAAFAVDASLLITKFRGVEYNIPHIYISLLAFSPQCSIVANHYRARAVSMVIPPPCQMPLRWDRWDDTCTQFSDGSLDDVANNTPDTSTNNVSHSNLANRHAGRSTYNPAESSVTSLCFSPNKEQHLAVGYEDGVIRVWDVQGRKCVIDLMSANPLGTLSYSPNGSLLAYSGKGESCIWNSRTGDMVFGPLKCQSLHGTLIAFSPDRTFFASRTSSPRAIEVCDANSGEIVRGLLKDPSRATGKTRLAYSPGAILIAAGSGNGYVRAWDVQSGEEMWSNRPHRSSINALSFSPDGRRLASASKDRTIRILDTHTRTYTQDPLKGHTEAVNSISFSPDNCYIASGSDDRTLRIWDTKTGACLAGPIGGHTRAISAVAFSPDGKYLASGSRDGIVRLWDVRALLRGKQSEGRNAREAPGRSRLTDQTVVDQDGFTLGPEGERLFCAPEPYNACIWRPSTVKILGRGLPTINMIKPDLSKLITGEEWKKTFPGT